MPQRGRPTLTPEEAKQLHYEALVIDSQQPPATNGFLFTDRMRTALQEYHRQGMTRGEAGELLGAMAVREIQTSPEARKSYLDLWDRSGVTVASATYAGPGTFSEAFERSVRGMAQARAIIDALDEFTLMLKADDIEQAHLEGKHGLIFDFQDTTPFADRLDRIDLFHNLGLRVVQLTYNLRNLVGDGCTETHKSGLTYFGREVVQRLNELHMAVDVSHCSEQVGWDALEVSSAPIIITHSASADLCYHDRGKSDALAKAVADKGGYFGVVVIAGFLQESHEATLDHFVDHVEHLIDVMGIEHVGIGTDKAGPGPGTESLIEYPADMPATRPGAFNWRGFREEHRISPEYHMNGFENFGDWPNLTVKLAERGFNEEELRNLLGLNSCGCSGRSWGSGRSDLVMRVATDIYQLRGITGSNIFLIEEQRITVVDAGAPGSARRILEYVRALGRGPEEIGLILLPHGHPDHYGGVQGIRASSGAQVLAHPGDVSVSRRGVARAQYPWTPFPAGPVVDGYLEEGQLLSVLGGLRVHHTPGHGSFCPSNGSALLQEFARWHLGADVPLWWGAVRNVPVLGRLLGRAPSPNFASGDRGAAVGKG